MPGLLGRPRAVRGGVSHMSPTGSQKQNDPSDHPRVRHGLGQSLPPTSPACETLGLPRAQGKIVGLVHLPFGDHTGSGGRLIGELREEALRRR